MSDTKISAARSFAESFCDHSLTSIGLSEMPRAARNLPALEAGNNGGEVELHFLSGSDFWYQTCFCAYSLLLHSPSIAGVVIHSDGTLKAEQTEILQRVFPGVRINDSRHILDGLNKNFPEEIFPTLHLRSGYWITMRKLTVVHGGSSGWKLCLDSDMLFFKRPAMLLDWLNSPSVPCYLQGRGRAFGYSHQLMSSLVEGTIPSSLNSGIFGFNSAAIDWTRLEHWAQTLLHEEGSRYLMEQGLSAMLIAGNRYVEFPNSEYRLCPDVAEASAPVAVMHHYAGHTRPLMFRYGWRHIKSRPRSAAI